MPLAVALPAIIGAAGVGSSAAGGKKARNSANSLAGQQLDLQKQQFGLAQQQLGLGNKQLGGASNYWNALLSGSGNAAQQATGPYASMIGQAAQGSRNAIQALTPRGGEQNLALAQNYNQAGNDIARLYTGMQPLAAQNLQNIGGQYLGSAGGFNPGSSPGAAAGIYGQQMQSAGEAGGGFGNLLYEALKKGGRGTAAPATAGGKG